MDEVELVAEPLHRRPADEYASLQGVLYFPAQPDGNRGNEAALTLYAPLPGVHEEETARAVGILGLPLVETGLPEERGLLVSGDSGDWNLRALYANGAVDLTARVDLREYRHGNVEALADGLVPAQVSDVVEHGTACVGEVGDMYRAARELPDEPRIHGAEQ